MTSAVPRGLEYYFPHDTESRAHMEHRDLRPAAGGQRVHDGTGVYGGPIQDLLAIIGQSEVRRTLMAAREQERVFSGLFAGGGHRGRRREWTGASAGRRPAQHPGGQERGLPRSRRQTWGGHFRRALRQVLRKSRRRRRAVVLSCDAAVADQPANWWAVRGQAGGGVWREEGGSSRVRLEVRQGEAF